MGVWDALFGNKGGPETGQELLQFGSDSHGKRKKIAGDQQLETNLDKPAFENEANETPENLTLVQAIDFFNEKFDYLDSDGKRRSNGLKVLLFNNDALTAALETLAKKLKNALEILKTSDGEKPFDNKVEEFLEKIEETFKQVKVLRFQFGQQREPFNLSYCAVPFRPSGIDSTPLPLSQAPTWRAKPAGKFESKLVRALSGVAEHCKGKGVNDFTVEKIQQMVEKYNNFNPLSCSMRKLTGGQFGFFMSGQPVKNTPKNRQAYASDLYNAQKGSKACH